MMILENRHERIIQIKLGKLFQRYLSIPADQSVTKGQQLGAFQMEKNS